MNYRSKLFIPISFFALCLSTSCNAMSLNRKNLTKLEDYNVVKTKLENIHKAQEKGLFNRGTITFKRKGSANGSFRLDQVSYHNINFSVSTGYTISWSLDDHYFNLVGENDNVHIIGNKEGTEYWHYSKNITNKKEYKYRYQITDTVLRFDSFSDFVIDQIEYYTILFIPAICSYCGGITGDNNYKDFEWELIKIQPETLVPNDLFSQSLHDEASRLAEFYKNKGNGCSASLTYGSNDDQSLDATFKGKVNHTDVTGTRFEDGYSEFNNYVCFKDNFINQVEYNMKGLIINSRKVNLNCNYSIHIIEELTKDKCAVETINHDEYLDGDPD